MGSSYNARDQIVLSFCSCLEYLLYLRVATHFGPKMTGSNCSHVVSCSLLEEGERETTAQGRNLVFHFRLVEPTEVKSPPALVTVCPGEFHAIVTGRPYYPTLGTRDCVSLLLIGMHTVWSRDITHEQDQILAGRR